MKKKWYFLISLILILFNSSLVSCGPKFELTELFQSTKHINISTDEVNHLVEMKVVNDINEKNKINFESIDFVKLLNFFLKKGKNLDKYIILEKKPVCYDNPCLKNKKAIHTTFQGASKQYNVQLTVEFCLNMYCVWKKEKNTYNWVKTTLTKNIVLIIRSDQKIIILN